jgi:hypothetical protein
MGRTALQTFKLNKWDAAIQFADGVRSPAQVVVNSVLKNSRAIGQLTGLAFDFVVRLQPGPVNGHDV